MKHDERLCPIRMLRNAEIGLPYETLDLATGGISTEAELHCIPRILRRADSDGPRRDHR